MLLTEILMALLGVWVGNGVDSVQGLTGFSLPFSRTAEGWTSWDRAWGRAGREGRLGCRVGSTGSGSQQ